MFRLQSQSIFAPFRPELTEKPRIPFGFLQRTAIFTSKKGLKQPFFHSAFNPERIR